MVAEDGVRRSTFKNINSSTNFMAASKVALTVSWFVLMPDIGLG